ncbi:MAG: hypothetical protein KJO07_14850 [Deltaproteobacteria bacterium]|nr:hypothetical protein [Deltaproteobacteria bacterium]
MLIGAVCVWALALLISPAFAVVIGLPTFVAAGLIAADLAGASPKIEKRRRFLNERKQ